MNCSFPLSHGKIPFHLVLVTLPPQRLSRQQREPLLLSSQNTQKVEDVNLSQPHHQAQHL